MGHIGRWYHSTYHQRSMDLVGHTLLRQSVCMTFTVAHNARRTHPVYIQTLGIIILWAILWERAPHFGHIAFTILGWTHWISRDSHIRTPIFLIRTFQLPIWLLSQIVLGSIDTPLSPQSGWRRDWDPQPSDFGDILSHYTDGRMNQGQGLEACGKSIRRLERANKPLRVTVYDDGLHEYFRRTLKDGFQSPAK